MREKGQITWNINQVTELKKAVRNFNNKIKRLEKLDNINYLPSKVIFSEEKNTILTRQELNRRINELKRFSRRGSEKLASDTIEPMTVWERNELINKKRTASRSLKKEYNEIVKQNLNIPFKDITKYSNRANEIIGTLNSINSLFKRKGQSFERIAIRLNKLGRSDRSFLQAVRYKKYYLRNLERYSNFSNYEKIINKINSINVLELYDKLGYNINLQDLDYMSDQVLTEEDFNLIFEEFINDEKEEEKNEKVKVFFVYKNGIVVAYYETYDEAMAFVKKQPDRLKYKITEEEINL